MQSLYGMLRGRRTVSIFGMLVILTTSFSIFPVEPAGGEVGKLRSKFSGQTTGGKTKFSGVAVTNIWSRKIKITAKSNEGVQCKGKGA